MKSVGSKSGDQFPLRFRRPKGNFVYLQDAFCCAWCLAGFPCPSVIRWVYFPPLVQCWGASRLWTGRISGRIFGACFGARVLGREMYLPSTFHQNMGLLYRPSYPTQNGPTLPAHTLSSPCRCLYCTWACLRRAQLHSQTVQEIITMFASATCPKKFQRRTDLIFWGDSFACRAQHTEIYPGVWEYLFPVRYV